MHIRLLRLQALCRLVIRCCVSVCIACRRFADSISRFFISICIFPTSSINASDDAICCLCISCCIRCKSSADTICCCCAWSCITPMSSADAICCCWIVADVTPLIRFGSSISAWCVSVGVARPMSRSDSFTPLCNWSAVWLKKSLPSKGVGVRQNRAGLNHQAVPKKWPG